jgi:hypothetical protein
MQILACERRLMLQNRPGNNHCMMFPQLAHFADVALLLLRVMVGIVFILCSNDAANIAGAA